MHLTKSRSAAEKLEKHAGSLFTPPFEPKRYAELQWASGQHSAPLLSRCVFVALTLARCLLMMCVADSGREFSVDGVGWMESCADIVLPGLGWIAITASSAVTVRVYIAGGEAVSKHVTVRPPLMPYEARSSTKRWTGTHHLH